MQLLGVLARVCRASAFGTRVGKAAMYYMCAGNTTNESNRKRENQAELR